MFRIETKSCSPKRPSMQRQSKSDAPSSVSPDTTGVSNPKSHCSPSTIRTAIGEKPSQSTSTTRKKKPLLLWDLSIDELYKNPGSPVHRQLANGASVIREEGDSIYMRGQGASPEGDR